MDGTSRIWVSASLSLAHLRRFPGANIVPKLVFINSRRAPVKKACSMVHSALSNLVATIRGGRSLSGTVDYWAGSGQIVYSSPLGDHHRIDIVEDRSGACTALLLLLLFLLLLYSSCCFSSDPCPPYFHPHVQSPTVSATTSSCTSS